MVTIKELSESIGVSKVGITKWIERNGYKDQLQKIGNKYVIPADVEQKIRANFDRRELKKDKTVNTTTETENTVTSEIIALLREQLETKDREIEWLHTQIENLQQINADTVKALREANTLQAMRLSDGSDRAASTQAEQEPIEAASTVDPEEKSADPEPIEEKKGFFRRLFGL